MSYKLTVNEAGDVEFIKRAGEDFVRSSMCEGEAKALIETGKVAKSDKFDGFEIEVNGGEIYFAGKITADKPSKADTVAEEKADEKPKRGKKKAE